MTVLKKLWKPVSIDRLFYIGIACTHPLVSPLFATVYGGGGVSTCDQI
jgi:hypothetical protein